MSLSSKLSSNKLQKLKIKTEDDDEFQLMFNPETYNMTYTNKFSKCQAVGNSGKEQIYQKSELGSLKIKAIFDNTGAYFEGGKESDLKKQIDDFLKATVKIDGAKHRPKKVSVDWGNHIFDGYIQQLDITHRLFDREGKPIRADIDITFIPDIDDEKRKSEEDKSSPDLTHARTVNTGDNLPLMSQQIYNDPSCYIHIAKANGLNGFRKLETGRSLIFPPVAD